MPPPVCNIVTCGANKDIPKYSNLAFYRLPSAECMQREWVDSIGIENIKKFVCQKEILICSLHFHAEAFFKIHNNEIVLREDAVPTLERQISTKIFESWIKPSCDEIPTAEIETPEQVLPSRRKTRKQIIPSAEEQDINQDPSPVSSSSQNGDNSLDRPIKMEEDEVNSICRYTNMHLIKALKKNKVLNYKLDRYKRKIKHLNESVSRYKNRVEKLTKLVKELKGEQHDTDSPTQ